MCGIVGYIGSRRAADLLLAGLRALEYRGYDSAGIATVVGGKLQLFKVQGKIAALEAKVDRDDNSNCGIGHTRWATHGKVSLRNAHPIVDYKGQIAVVHNGIVENFLSLRKSLEYKGVSFSTDTDTEIIVNLIAYNLYNGESIERAVKLAIDSIEGYFAFAAITSLNAESIVVSKRGAPLILGIGEGEFFVASDAMALLPFTRRVVYLEDDDIAIISSKGINVWDKTFKAVERDYEVVNWDPVSAEKGSYKHFMQKEIFEQPRAVYDTISGRIDPLDKRTILEVELPKEIDRIQIVACGTSYHAGLVGKFLIENLAGVPTEVDYASEFRYRNPLLSDKSLLIGITQSGETTDTLRAVELARDRGLFTLAVCNVPMSQITRITDETLLTHAGPEIGVASTKAFTTQLVALYLLAIALGESNGYRFPHLIEDLLHLPVLLDSCLRGIDSLDGVSDVIYRSDSALFLGRGINFPIALEGALKLKEITYIHAEGYPAGEMKHGPIALIDEKMPVFGISGVEDQLNKKLKSNLQEVSTRGGKLIIVTPTPEAFSGLEAYLIPVPKSNQYLQPIVNVIPLQMIAYLVGVRLGLDVDQPRNLAKSVTVE